MARWAMMLPAVARRSPAMIDAVGVAQGHHRGGVRHRQRRPRPRRHRRRAVGRVTGAGQPQQSDEVGPRVFVPGERAAAPPGLLPALLHVVAHELLGVVLEHLVDLVEQVVELGLDLLAALADAGRRLLDRPRSRSRSVGWSFFFCSCSAIVVQPSVLRLRLAAQIGPAGRPDPCSAASSCVRRVRPFPSGDPS